MATAVSDKSKLRCPKFRKTKKFILPNNFVIKKSVPSNTEKKSYTKLKIKYLNALKDKFQTLRTKRRIGNCLAYHNSLVTKCSQEFIENRSMKMVEDSSAKGSKYPRNIEITVNNVLKIHKKGLCKKYNKTNEIDNDLLMNASKSTQNCEIESPYLSGQKIGNKVISCSQTQTIEEYKTDEFIPLNNDDLCKDIDSVYLDDTVIILDDISEKSIDLAENNKSDLSSSAFCSVLVELRNKAKNNDEINSKRPVNNSGNETLSCDVIEIMDDSICDGSNNVHNNNNNNEKKKLSDELLTYLLANNETKKLKCVRNTDLQDTDSHPIDVSHKNIVDDVIEINDSFVCPEYHSSLKDGDKLNDIHKNVGLPDIESQLIDVSQKNIVDDVIEINDSYVCTEHPFSLNDEADKSNNILKNAISRDIASQSIDDGQKDIVDDIIEINDESVCNEHIGNIKLNRKRKHNYADNVNEPPMKKRKASKDTISINYSDNPVSCTLLSQKQINTVGKKKNNNKRKKKKIKNKQANSDPIVTSHNSIQVLKSLNVPSRNNIVNYVQCNNLTNAVQTCQPASQTFSTTIPTSFNFTMNHPNSSKNFNVSNNFYNAGTVNKTGLRTIIIDGSNVAMGHSNGKFFSVRGLQICVNYFLQRGHKVKAFVPHFRTKLGFSSDPKLLQRLCDLGHVILTPSREINGKRIVSYDDRFIVQSAAELEGVIVSSDNYRDLMKENPNLIKVIENRLLMPTWLDDMIIFPPDPLGKYGPNLDRFLQFP